MAQARGRYTSDPGPRFDRCKEDATRLLARAAGEWAEGDPSHPDPADVLENSSMSSRGNGFYAGPTVPVREQRMAERPDKASRKAALAAWKAQQLASERARLPLPPWRLQELFDALDEELSRRGCDQTRRMVREWCDRSGVDAASLEAWLREHGGYCDCGALVNAGQDFEEAMKDA